MKNRIIHILLFCTVSSIVFFNISCAAVPRYYAKTTLDGTYDNARIEKIKKDSDYSIYEIGVASYYADKFQGKKTANGEIFDKNQISAAHKELPFDTMVKVTNLYNNKSVMVRINDRGPFVDGRVIDLSEAAAQEIDMVTIGTAPVRLEIIQ